MSGNNQKVSNTFIYLTFIICVWLIYFIFTVAILVLFCNFSRAIFLAMIISSILTLLFVIIQTSFKHLNSINNEDD
ncbi:hypothetical protein B0W51_06385 [Leuconostoc mesenteroides]|nr:hypothetical protein B0W51_06385 [Leuconostoc mesenteroides]